MLTLKSNSCILTWWMLKSNSWMNKFFFFIKKRKKKSPRHKWTRQSGLGKSTNNDVTLTWGERCYCLLLAWDWESTIRVSQSPPSLLLLFGFGPFGWAEMRWDDEAKSKAKAKAKGNPFFCFLQTFSLPSQQQYPLSFATSSIFQP